MLPVNKKDYINLYPMKRIT